MDAVWSSYNVEDISVFWVFGILFEFWVVWVVVACLRWGVDLFGFCVVSFL